MEQELFSAASRGQTENVRRLLVESRANPNAKDARGIPALLMAAQENHLPVVQLLIDHGCDVNATCSASMHCMTALYQALSKGVATTGVVMALLDAGADPHKPLPTPRCDNCSYMAAETGNVAVMRRLLHHNKIDPDGPRAARKVDIATPLFAAAQGAFDEVINLLLDEGASINLGIGMGGTRLSPLGIAAEHGHASSVALLLKRGADPNFVDRAGNGALTKAAFFRRADIILLLARVGCNLLTANAYGVRPCDLVHGNIGRSRLATPGHEDGAQPREPDSPHHVIWMMMRCGVDLTLEGATDDRGLKRARAVTRPRWSTNDPGMKLHIEIRLSPHEIVAGGQDQCISPSRGAYAVARDDGEIPTLGQVRCGSVVIVCNLTSTVGAKINGNSGIVRGYDTKKRRFEIALDNSCRGPGTSPRIVKIKAANIRIVTRRDANIRLIELSDGGRSEPMWRDLRFVVFRDWALFPELRASVMRNRRFAALSSVCERRAGPAASVMSDVLRTHVVKMLG